jgi:hypothetical protein
MRLPGRPVAHAGCHAFDKSILADLDAAIAAVAWPEGFSPATLDTADMRSAAGKSRKKPRLSRYLAWRIPHAQLSCLA